MHRGRADGGALTAAHGEHAVEFAFGVEPRHDGARAVHHRLHGAALVAGGNQIGQLGATRTSYLMAGHVCFDGGLIQHARVNDTSSMTLGLNKVAQKSDLWPFGVECSDDGDGFGHGDPKIYLRDRVLDHQAQMGDVENSSAALCAAAA